MLEPLLRVINRASAAVDVPDYDWAGLLCYISLGAFIFSTVLDWRQYKVLERTTVPPEVAHIVDTETFLKTQKYDRAKLRFSVAKNVGDLVLTVVAYKSGSIEFVYTLGQRLLQLAGLRFFQGDIAQNVVFFVLWSFLFSVLALPWGWYKRFVLEEKFGFNKETPYIFATDFVKDQIVSALIMGAIMAALVKIDDYFGDVFFVYASVLMLIFTLVLMVLFPTVIQPLFNKYTPMEDGELKDKVLALATKLDFPVKRLYVQDGSTRSAHSNAYFTGLPWYKQIVLFDTLIDECTTEEIVAVLGHELGHWKLNHIAKNLVLTTVLSVSIFTGFAIFVKNRSLYASFGFHKTQPLAVGLLLFSDMVTPIGIFLQFGISSLTRKFEYDADKFAVQLGYGKQLSSALIKMQKSNLSTVNADPWYSTYHFSHPILPERLRALNAETAKVSKKKD